MEDGRREVKQIPYVTSKKNGDNKFIRLSGIVNL